jgi:hypothetical protein
LYNVWHVWIVISSNISVKLFPLDLRYTTKVRINTWRHPAIDIFFKQLHLIVFIHLFNSLQHQMCDKVEVWQWMTMYYLPLWLIYIYILLLSFFFILNRMEFWNLLLITKKILIEFHTFFLFFWCCKELNRCINTIKWSCLKKISMAGCLQVLILTFVVFLVINKRFQNSILFKIKKNDNSRI